MVCLICQNKFKVELSLIDVFSFNPLIPLELCQQCENKFELNQPRQANCLYCDQRLEGMTCLDCLVWQKIYPQNRLNHQSLFRYNKAMQDWFYEYKYLGNLRLSRTFTKELQAYFKEWSNWLIVPIPLSPSRLAQRGFNQVEELLKAAQVEYVSLLGKKRHVMPQTRKNKRERLQTEQSFYLKRGGRERLQGQKVLIFDDVFTTGRTMYHARDCLVQGDLKEIRSFSLAR